jgi:HEAT repeat protein
LSGIISGGGNPTLRQARKTEDCLEQLHRLRGALPSPEAVEELRTYLHHKSNLVVAKAAQLTREFELHDLRADLVRAFDRFMQDPTKTDRGCSAKTEVVRGLESLGAPEGVLFLTGIRHVQMEGSFGPPIDTAAGLRAASAMGLVHMNHPDAILEIVTLLVDREGDARVGAVRALGWSGRPESVPLLRLKALEPEPSVDVMGECFTALLAIAPGTSVDFVARHLDSPDVAIAEAAALALGESHLPAAVQALINKWGVHAADTLRSALVAGLALARTDSAFEFLFSRIETAKEKVGVEIIAALAVYRHDDRIRARLAALVESRNGKTLQDAFNAAFVRS